ncbi:hypothetical protein SERLA73DRAFT_182588 [Serpula lacrymans var. lacrymans S7.3]|uniref:Uncharacterized protein n=2 Tax=Serpula lacrymans var. lacrymans TaxID=341189 RepID=F8Q0J9_SERL3|nr:uncharacterized protein SERLADRAFT_469318 [Serpula lacrymans var. lacrymans S7.9]EGN97828.1 hypothetical protein SERLA73DRAFT_182588 [Serpula lacrymans var. lacrymans S7.3]EGO23420.1 hypothetical protein SERLADRAFT_469318 [Serpula lacrymans var. lacrymans S7.9]
MTLGNSCQSGVKRISGVHFLWVICLVFTLATSDLENGLQGLSRRECFSFKC